MKPEFNDDVAPDPNIEALKVFINDRGPFFLHTHRNGDEEILLHGHKKYFRYARFIELKSRQIFIIRNSPCSSGIGREHT